MQVLGAYAANECQKGRLQRLGELRPEAKEWRKGRTQAVIQNSISSLQI